jgi:UPF0271 protein
LKIDLNADLGEGASLDEQILELVSSANLACGFHAGTPESVLASIGRARERRVAIGAHPSFNDRMNFGRKELDLAAGEIFSLVLYQLGAFQGLCRAAGAQMNHVKPHGALYNMGARDFSIADPIARAIAALDPQLILFAPPRSALEEAARKLDLQIALEFFADRNYNRDGSLVSRTQPDALLHDPQEAAERVMTMLREKKVRALDGTNVPISADTICVHGDTPGAVDFVRALREHLEEQGITVAAPCRQS